jgi:hypothetical protein
MIFIIQEIGIIFITAFNMQCFRVLKFQSTSHELLFSISTVFYFVLVYIEYLIYFLMLSKKHLFGSDKRNKKKRNEELKNTTMS